MKIKNETLDKKTLDQNTLLNNENLTKFINLNQIILDKLTTLEDTLVEKYLQKIALLQDQVKELSLSLPGKRS